MRKLENILIGILLVLAFVGITLSFSGKSYIYKTILHQEPGIDDLDLFPHHFVATGQPALPWPLAPDYQKVQPNPKLRAVLEEYGSVAYLLIERGQLRYEEYWEGYGPTKNSNSFSVAKSIVSILIGIAHQEGAIASLDDPVGRYVPSYRDSARSKVTIRHLLQMTSGLSFEEAYNKLISDTAEAYYGTDLQRLVDRLTVEEQPGTVREYRSGDTQLLALALRGATGMPLADYASSRLWQPLGAETPAQWSLDWEDGIEKAYCCFYSNARDFARIGQLYLQGGYFNGQQIINPEYVRQSITPHGVPSANGVATTDYGYQWWIMELDDRQIFYARGILGQYIVVIPDRQMVIVRLGHRRGEKNAANIPADLPRIIKGTLETFDRPLTYDGQFPQRSANDLQPVPTEPQLQRTAWPAEQAPVVSETPQAGLQQPSGHQTVTAAPPSAPRITTNGAQSPSSPPASAIRPESASTTTDTGQQADQPAANSLFSIVSETGDSSATGVNQPHAETGNSHPNAGQQPLRPPPPGGGNADML